MAHGTTYSASRTDVVCWTALYCLLLLLRIQHHLWFRSIPVFFSCFELGGRVLVECARTWVGRCLGSCGDCTGLKSHGSEEPFCLSRSVYLKLMFYIPKCLYDTLDKTSQSKHDNVTYVIILYYIRRATCFDSTWVIFRPSRVRSIQ
jgi:hypothetical protein